MITTNLCRSAVNLRHCSVVVPLVARTKWHTVLDQAYNKTIHNRSYLFTYCHAYNKHNTYPRQCRHAFNTPSLTIVSRHTNHHATIHNTSNSIESNKNNDTRSISNTTIHHNDTISLPTQKPTASTIKHITRTYKKSMTPNMIKDNKWLVLCKIRIGVWNMIAASLAYMTMSHGTITGLLCCAVGTLCYASSSLAWNQLNEVEYDKNMVRTMNRPIIKQTITTQQAKLFIATTTILGFAFCYAANGIAPALIGLSTVLGYVYVYTPLKRTTIYNTEVGAIIGAMPVLLGCVAADGIQALYYIQTWIQYGLMFAWQIPHFYTIAWRQRFDYATAGFKMISLNDITGHATTYAGIKWFALLWTLPFILDYYGYTTEMFIVCSIFLNLIFSWSYVAFIINPTRFAATTQYISYIHIIGILAALNLFTLGKPEWTTLQGIRKAGYTYCIHPILMAANIKIDNLPDWLCTHMAIEKSQHHNTERVNSDTDVTNTQQIVKS